MRDILSINLDRPFSFENVFVKDHLRIIATDTDGWDHVSVSCADRCPTWEEMCWVKDIFFFSHEIAVQYHPSEKEYVNCHPFCLHLWRPQTSIVPTPPKVLVL